MIPLLGCTEPEMAGHHAVTDTVLDVVTTEQPTVYAVRWTADTDTAWVDASDALGTRRFAAQRVDGAFEALVVLPAGSTVTLQAGWGEGTSAPVEVTPADPPVGWPQFIVDTDDGTAEGYVVGGLTDEAQDTYGVYAIDRHGRYVWWVEGDAAHIADAHLSGDGAYVEWLSWDPGGAIVRRSIDGTQEETFLVPGIHHSFLSRGRDWVTLGTDSRDWAEDVTVVGDTLTFIDAEGVAEATWSVWDALVPNEDALQGAIDAEGTPLVYDWTHGNGVAWDEARDRWWVSLRNIDAIVQVDGATGAVDWILGGPHAAFTLSEGTPFSMQHSPRRLDNGNLLLFDNGLEARASSRAVEYAIDEANRSYRQVWEYVADPPIFGTYTGSADRLADGATFICWGAAGVLSEVDADGVVRWQAHQSGYEGLGFAQVTATLGSVSTPAGR